MESDEKSGSSSACEEQRHGCRIHGGGDSLDHNRDADAAAVEVSDAAEQSEYIQMRNRGRVSGALDDAEKLVKFWR